MPYSDVPPLAGPEKSILYQRATTYQEICRATNFHLQPKRCPKGQAIIMYSVQYSVTRFSRRKSVKYAFFTCFEANFIDAKNLNSFD